MRQRHPPVRPRAAVVRRRSALTARLAALPTQTHDDSTRQQHSQWNPFPSRARQQAVSPHILSYFQYGRLIARTGIVSETADPEIYSWERYGNFSYAIPVAHGSYTVSLHFAESFFGSHGPGDNGAGMRLFDVFLNGAALLRNFDMFAEAGFRHALVKTFHGVHANPQGKLLFSFVPSKNYASISVIEAVDESE